ncbi:hypothetical protein CO180_04045 [candidate division WWE3 bacterium CG_4_9_14_3_um_filter_41_6]|uniref:DUF1648 domain-containing protein n=1 Tax=candidate division WWE3 bacterium CG_4_10_14_0_2_um_filter_41_14 TaxID=1975072 RepID=A0A2M7TGF9_UNCKA|nr:MAG: hypothetical protein COY32_05600 [candidate division WWE3 bacterium CG_4_10_14_0_2_um_filter_41_14]PJA38218.1 MAG: hypothetical protein CO180_04045 [candidate division WWE3 bacterium CG_4_9_14_3_um_filter_41_6]
MFKNRTVVVHTIVSLLISQISFWLIFLHRTQLPPTIPLWFMQKESVDVLSDVTYIWLLPGLSVLFLALYLLITALIHRHQPYIVGITMAASTCGSLFLLIATLNILSKVLGWG